MKIESNRTVQLFIDNINKYYCIKSHLAERLSDSLDVSAIKSKKKEIRQLIADKEQQLDELNDVFGLLKTTYSFTNCTNIITLLDDYLDSFQYSISDDPELTNYLLLSYLVNVQSFENTIGYLLTTLSDNFEDNSVCSIVNYIVKQDKQLISSAFLDSFDFTS